MTPRAAAPGRRGEPRLGREFFFLINDYTNFFANLVLYKTTVSKDAKLEIDINCERRISRVMYRAVSKRAPFT